MKKILIIGSKGFIGSNMVTYLTADKSNEVYGCDVVTDYTAVNYFLIDASNANYQEIFETIDVDVCVNCSGAASVPDSFEHPYRDFLLNTTNVVALLDAIKKHSPACRFINLSSAAVYGNPESLPIPETAGLHPLSPYGHHKLMAEEVCEEYYRFFGIQTCSARIFSAYGNGLKKQLFWDLSQKVKGANELTLFGTGAESRDFIHVADIARSIGLIINKGVFDGKSYNIANGAEITIKNAAEQLVKCLEWEGELKFNGDNRPGDPLNWRADISRITSLGYQPTVTIEKGLNDYAAWLREEKLV